MPSLLERVGRSLTRKKPEIITNNRDSVVTALEGFETVSPADVKGYVPPSATSPSQEKSQGAFQSFLRAKSPSRNAAPQAVTAPILSLHLPEISETGSSGDREKMGITFEHQPDPIYTDEVVAAKRLNTAETLFLVQKTSSALAQKGLETPGIFKTFWHAQNPASQRKLIIAFLQTLSIDETAQAPVADATAETKETTPALDTFNNLLHNTSPYDLAEVFKWAVRHFRYDARSFGTSADEYGWYKTFAESEKTASYPSDAYSTILAPLLPPAHLELLNSIFQLASSVAAYGEINGVSGSKLSRSVGWWLLSERPRPTNGLVGFLQDWDTAARILEHLFLAYVRDQQRLGLMPKRLTQLVKAYPYPKQANPTTDAHYLPRPKFSTQQRTVLFVRAAVPSNAVDFYHGHPIQLLKDSIVAPPEDGSANAEYRAIWESLKRQATAENNGPSEPSSPVDLTQGAPVVSVATLLSESGVHTLTSASGESAKTSPVKATGDLESSWIRSFSPAARKTSSVAGADSTNTTAPQSPMEWDDFTGMGFAGGLNDSTTLSFSDFAPPPTRQGSATVGGGTKSSRTSRMSSRHRRSMEFGQRPRTTVATNGHGAGSPKTEDTKTFPNKDASAIISDSAEPPLEIDETLIDGWAEILTDKAVASRTWPTFALYELRNPLTVPVATSSVNGGGPAEPNRIKWLAIETYVNPPPTREASAPSSPTKGGKTKRSNSVSSGKRSRFGFFSSTTSLAGKDKELGGKEEKKEKRKEHNRRASEISTDSVGAKIKEPASRSQADLSAPPAIAEEPEPTTPLKVVPEEKAIPDTAVAEKKAEVFPPKDSAPAASTLAPINTLPVPNAEGSRFVEGGTPGTIPESVTTEPAPHEDKSEVATTAVVGASAAGIPAATAATVLLKQDSEPNVPVSEDQTGTVDNNAAIHTEVSAQPTESIVDESQQGQPSIPTETIDSDAAALAQAREDALKSEEDVMLKVQQQREANELERQRVLKEQEEAQRLQDEARAEAARVEAAQVEREQAELRAKEEERVRLELEERARVEAAEKQAELDRLAAMKAEEDRLDQAREDALKAEEDVVLKVLQQREANELERQRVLKEQEEAQRLQDEARAEAARVEAARVEREQAELRAKEEERVRLELEERARVEAAEKQAELDRLAALKAEEERLAALKVEEERLAEIAREEERIRLEMEERARVEAAEKQAELDRLAALNAEEERLAALKAEEDRLAAQKAEEERLAEIAREEERLRLEMEERARVEAAEKQAELDRLAALKAEEERLAAQKAEEERLAEIAREEERIRLETEERARIEAAEKQAELDRLAALKAEEEKLAAQQAEEERLAALKAEEDRLAAQKAEEERLAEIAREEERLRLETEERARAEAAEKQAELDRLAALKAEEERLAALKAEEERQAEIARLEAEELERQRIAKEAEELAAQKLLEEQKAEQLRLEAEELEKQRVAQELAEREAKKREEEARLQAEELEHQRLAEEQAEKQRIADEQAAEEARIAEEARLEEERRVAAIEQERLDAEKAAAEAAVIPEPVVDTHVGEAATAHAIPGDDHEPTTTEDAPVKVPATTEDTPVEESTKVEETQADEPAV